MVGNIERAFPCLLDSCRSGGGRTGEKMDSPGARLLGSFGFPNAELQHADRLVETYRDLLQLLWRIMRDTNDGFGFMRGLPLLDQRDKRTLMAAMLTRS